MEKIESLPSEKIDALIQASFEMALSLAKDQKNLSEAVVRLSTHYIESPEKQTPWNESWCQAAYLGYFFPMGLIRVRRVFGEAKSLGFFEGCKSFIDFGSGLGTASFVLDELELPIHSIEIADVAVKYHRRLIEKFSALSERSWSKRIEQTTDRDSLICVNSLTEFSKIPTWLHDFQNLVLIEPSTYMDSRRLMEFRSRLMENGFAIWGPCTHQSACPLLTHSKRDWCHDKTEVRLPEIVQSFVDRLPIRGSELGLSYLLASKRRPPDLSLQARVVGDLLVEKGKSRQMICRDSDRLFLTWMKKDHKRAPDISRGCRIQVDGLGEQVSNELRVQKGRSVPII